jgi:hypothetical protein
MNMDEIEVVVILKGKIEDGIHNESGFFFELEKQISKLAKEFVLEGYIERVQSPLRHLLRSENEHE